MAVLAPPGSRLARNGPMAAPAQLRARMTDFTSALGSPSSTPRSLGSHGGRRDLLPRLVTDEEDEERFFDAPEKLRASRARSAPNASA